MEDAPGDDASGPDGDLHLGAPGLHRHPVGDQIPGHGLDPPDLWRDGLEVEAPLRIGRRRRRRERAVAASTSSHSDGHHRVRDRPASLIEPIPIGTACPGEELLVLDADGRELPPGREGDLYIGGDTGPSWGVAFESVPKIIMISHASAENITKHWINTVTLHADAQRVPCWPCHRLHENFEHCHTIKINDGDFASCISDISSEAIVTNAARMLAS